MQCNVNRCNLDAQGAFHTMIAKGGADNVRLVEETNEIYDFRQTDYSFIGSLVAAVGDDDFAEPAREPYDL